MRAAKRVVVRPKVGALRRAGVAAAGRATRRGTPQRTASAKRIKPLAVAYGSGTAGLRFSGAVRATQQQRRPLPLLQEQPRAVQYGSVPAQRKAPQQETSSLARTCSEVACSIGKSLDAAKDKAEAAVQKAKTIRQRLLEGKEKLLNSKAFKKSMGAAKKISAFATQAIDNVRSMRQATAKLADSQDASSESAIVGNAYNLAQKVQAIDAPSEEHPVYRNEKVAAKLGKATGFAARIADKAYNIASKGVSYGSGAAALIAGAGERAQRLAGAAADLGSVVGKFGGTMASERAAELAGVVDSYGAKVKSAGDKLAEKSGAVDTIVTGVRATGAGAVDTLSSLGVVKHEELQPEPEKKSYLGAKMSKFMSRVRENSVVQAVADRAQRVASRASEYGQKLSEGTNKVSEVARRVTGAVETAGSRLGLVGQGLATIGSLTNSKAASEMGASLSGYGEKGRGIASEYGDVNNKVAGAVNTVVSQVSDAGTNTLGLMKRDYVPDEAPKAGFLRQRIQKLTGAIGEKLRARGVPLTGVYTTGSTLDTVGSGARSMADRVGAVAEKFGYQAQRAAGVLHSVGERFEKTAEVVRGIGGTTAKLAHAIGMDHLSRNVDERSTKLAERAMSAAEKLRSMGDRVQGTADKLLQPTAAINAAVGAAGDMMSDTGRGLYATAAEVANFQGPDRPNWLRRQVAKMTEKLSPAAAAIKKRADAFSAKMSAYGDKAVVNPLVQELGHTTLHGLNKGLGYSAKAFAKLDEGVDWAAKRAFKAVQAVRQTSLGVRVAEKADRFMESKLGKRVTRTLDDLRAIKEDVQAPFRKLEDFAGEKYADLGEKFRIDRAESKQAVKDVVATAAGVAKWAPVAAGIGHGISGFANVAVVARDAGIKAAAKLVKDQVVQYGTGKLSSLAMDGTSENMARSLVARMPVSSIAAKTNAVLDNEYVKKAMYYGDMAMTAKNAYGQVKESARGVRDAVGDFYDRGRLLSEANAARRTGYEQPLPEQTEQQSDQQSFELPEQSVSAPAA